MATRSHRAVNRFAMADGTLRHTKRQLHRCKQPAPAATSTQLPRHRSALYKDIEEVRTKQPLGSERFREAVK